MAYPSNEGVTASELAKEVPSTIVWVKSASDMPSNPVSTVQYWIDYAGLLEVNEITVPEGGLFIRGSQSDLTGFGSTADNFTLFNGENAGNVFLFNVYVSVTGANSRMNNLTSSGGKAYEMVNVNLYDCASLGEIDGYRQFSLINLGSFGGKPELTLSGSMNGIFINTCLTLGLDSDFTGSLFKEGTGLTLSNRFRSNMRADLPAGASFCDFSPSNFLDSSLCQMNGGQYSRNGAINSGDNGFFPNLNPEDLACEWRDNNGLRNTHEGGRLEITSESTTSITSSGTYFDAAGTWTATDLQHFSMPVNGQLRNDGKNPQEFLVAGVFVVDGDANDVVSVRVTKWDDSEGVFEPVATSTQQVLSIIGGRDVAIVSFIDAVTLEDNDYIKIQVANLSDTSNVTIENGSKFRLFKRP